MKLRTDALAGAVLVGLPALELVSGSVLTLWTRAAVSALGVLLLACVIRLSSNPARGRHEA
jgi:hypothetical protein